MTPDRARELLGGLASGILTPEERQTLFEAALHDQTLFNEVADELEFAAFLQSPETRAQLANRIEVEPERPRRWWAMRPAWLSLAAVLAASTLLFVVVRPRLGQVAGPVAQTEQVVKDSAAKEPPSNAVSGPKLDKMAGTPNPAKQQPIRQNYDDKQVALKAAKDENREEQAKPGSRRDAPMPAQSQTQQRATESARSFAPGPNAFSAGQQSQSQIPARPQAPMAAPAAPAPPPPPPALERPAEASLTGTVHDVSGTAVAGATVDIVNTSTNAATHVATDTNGRFVALSLPQGGPYTITAAARGFKKEERSGITISANQPAQIDIPLQVGEMADTVSVTAVSGLLPSGQAFLGQNQTQVAVLDFVNGGEQNQSGAQAADLLSNQLLNGRQVHVIDREKVQQAAQSQNTAGRMPSPQEAAALGRSVGADAVILGSIQAPNSPGAGGGVAKRKAAANVSVMAEVIDTKQAKPMAKMSGNGTSLQGATKDLGNQIESQLAKPMEGRVTRLNGDIVSIAFAEPAGLQIGARCEVIRGTRKIGELFITSVSGRSAFGRFTGTTRPRAGDRVTALR